MKDGVPGDGLCSSLVDRTSSSGKHDCDHQRAIEVVGDEEGDGGVGRLAGPWSRLYTFLHPYVKSSANARECPTIELDLDVMVGDLALIRCEKHQYLCIGD